MAKQAKRVLKARKSASASDDDSLLVRSAESLGRVIGSLQRQVREGSTRPAGAQKATGSRKRKRSARAAAKKR